MVGLGLIKECAIGKRATQRSCQGLGSPSVNEVQRLLPHRAEVRECLDSLAKKGKAHTPRPLYTVTYGYNLLSEPGWSLMPSVEAGLRTGRVEAGWAATAGAGACCMWTLLDIQRQSLLNPT